MMARSTNDCIGIMLQIGNTPQEIYTVNIFHVDVVDNSLDTSTQLNGSSVSEILKHCRSEHGSPAHHLEFLLRLLGLRDDQSIKSNQLLP